jgi:2'-5' RNA ligase
MKIRLFIGLKLARPFLYKVGEWRKGFENKFDVRWIKDENLHVTLVPPWYEHKDSLDKVVNKLSQFDKDISSFEIHFNRVEFGPGKSSPRLIWATGKKPKEIYVLEKILSQTLKKRGQRKSEFIHLTLARFNAKDFSKFPVKRLKERVDWHERIESFSLFESKLKRGGAEYSQLRRFEI